MASSSSSNVETFEHASALSPLEDDEVFRSHCWRLLRRKFHWDHAPNGGFNKAPNPLIDQTPRGRRNRTQGVDTFDSIASLRAHIRSSEPAIYAEALKSFQSGAASWEPPKAISLPPVPPAFTGLGAPSLSLPPPPPPDDDFDIPPPPPPPLPEHTNRSPRRARGTTSVKSHIHWTPEEDELLIELVDRPDKLPWSEVAKQFPGRTVHGCGCFILFFY